MSPLALFTYGTLVQIFAPVQTTESQFYKCNMDQGIVVNVTEAWDHPHTLTAKKITEYAVEHSCKLDYHTIRALYPEGRLRKIDK